MRKRWIARAIGMDAVGADTKVLEERRFFTRSAAARYARSIAPFSPLPGRPLWRYEVVREP